MFSSVNMHKQKRKHARLLYHKTCMFSYFLKNQVNSECCYFSNSISLLFVFQNYLYSSQLLIAISSIVIVQNALINALAKRALVISGIFRSIAARRIL